MNYAHVLLVSTLAVVLASGLAPEKPTGRRVINLPSKPAGLPFSNGILAGDTLYLSGQIGIDPETRRPPDDLEKEIHLALDGIKATLAEAGMTMDDLVYVTVYCPDISLYSRFNNVYETYFTGEFPARAFIGSGPLLLGGHFEVQGIAVKR